MQPLELVRVMVRYCFAALTYAYRPRYTEDLLKASFREFATRCIHDRDLMADHIQPAWLEVLDGFLALCRARSARGHDDRFQIIEAALNTWKAFGEALGVQEDAIRLGQVARMCENLGEVSGCGWHRCALYLSNKTIPLREGLICSGCKKVPFPANIRLGDRLKISIGAILWTTLPGQVCPRKKDCFGRAC